MSKGLIPRGHDEFDVFQSNFTTVVEPMLENLGITADSFKPLTEEKAKWQALYQKATNPQNRTQADVLARNSEQKIYSDLLRSFINRFILNNPQVSDADRERLGLHVSDGSRTPSPVPATVPVVTVSIGHQQHTVHFMNESATSKAKPAGVHGCEIWMKKGEAPKSDTDLAFVTTDTASPYILKFDSSEVGTMVYYRLRWVNTRGEVGPWSALVSAVIG
jgi:hypothetical protein